MIAASASSSSRGAAHAVGSDRDEQVVHGLPGLAVADELVHDAQAAVDRDHA